MLTGDKLETAENIAFSCRLITESMNKYYIRDKSIQELSKNLDSITKSYYAPENQEKSKSIIVEGATLAII